MMSKKVYYSLLLLGTTILFILAFIALVLALSATPARAQTVGTYTESGSGANIKQGIGVAPLTGSLFPPCTVPCQLGALTTFAATTNSYSSKRVDSASINGLLKATTGRFYAYALTNTAASVRYMQIYNKNSAPTVGTDTPIFTISIGAGQTVQLDMPIGIGFASGIAWAATTDNAVIPVTAAAAGEVVGSLWYF